MAAPGSVRTRRLIELLAGAFLGFFPGTFTLSGDCQAPFRRGDVQGDGDRDVSDAIHILGFLFVGTPAPGCLEAADTTDDGVLDLTDAVFLLEYLFLGARASRSRCL